ncbi:hypothetical protein AUR64_08265 [Haloprofundus marisrubri]|uniref:BioF2-like acetyltransferase domain-containing protein n=1 Tax=Haloprofundus marisrubri TaxID=1514971 RepID=A0A0W1RC67_9EURY|nr:GNAT family N-acetyltransferase [Haloprofundus marisrubri]KTG10648.1 hypothetical protein AUR64_08265 [Haloprofundus marisrubri]
MSISVERLSETGRTEREWDGWLERSSMATPFHQFEVLRVVAAEADATLHPLVGFKGEEPIGVFPVFEMNRGPLRLVKSPPEGVSIRKLGPVLLNHEKLKTRKRETQNERFVDACIEWVDEHCAPHRFMVQTSERYPDFRPWVWNGFDVEMGATYVVDLDRDLDEIRQSFSRSVRKRVRRAEEAGCTVEIGGRAEARRIVDHIYQRFADSDIPYFDSEPELVMRYVDALPDEQVRPYVCRLDGEYVSGVINVRFGDVVYSWKGGARPLRDVPANELLDWHGIADAKESGATQFDFQGALERRTSGAKAKFSPDLVPTYSLTRQHRAIQLGTLLQGQAEDVSTTLRASVVSNSVPLVALRQLGRWVGAGNRLIQSRK